jgi:hypothetical protein
MKIKVFSFASIILWGLMALVSVNHLFPFCHVLQLSSSELGYLGWTIFVLSISVLGYRFWKALSWVFLFFFLLGWSVGPFLEPPGDPLDHIARSYATCGKTSVDMPRVNEGLWQYSMLGNILCHDRYSLPPKDVLNRIDIANGVFWAFSASLLFVLGIRAGLPATWAFFSVCFAFLFMGTNRFSYFSYYSFAASFSSMWIYWLWIAAFFFKQQGCYVLPGIVGAGLCLPILVVNHIQEAMFVSLICGVWVLYFLVRLVASSLAANHRLWRYPGWWLFLVLLFVLFFILPQWAVFQAGLRHLFIRDNWQAFHDTLVTWNGLHLIGKIWAYRVHDTLGFFGILPVLMIPLFVFSRVIGQHNEKKWLILLLGLLPFTVYCTPFLNFVWTSNLVTTEVYYRVCYNSLFWLPLSLVLCDFESYIRKWTLWDFLQSKKMFNAVFVSFCVLCSVVLSCKQSGPIYGKLDFITVDSKKWWDAWQPMIEKVVTWKKEKIDTDYITSYVLSSIFDIPTKYQYRQSVFLFGKDIPRRRISTLVQNSIVDDRTGCLINLHGFRSTWVPLITGQWSPYWSKPSNFYQVDIKVRERVSDYLHENTQGNCYVFY